MIEQAEQQEILKSKDPSVEGPRLTWEDTKKMVYTNKVTYIHAHFSFKVKI